MSDSRVGRDPIMQRVPVDGAELAVVVQGVGEVVVLIHGGMIADELAPLARRAGAERSLSSGALITGEVTGRALEGIPRRRS
ncbi:MAG: hypothetical protein ACRDTT_21420, partial [Pseudonocardiaceae bacterium]